MTMRITLLFEPSADRNVPFAAGPERYQRFADELSRYAGTPVPIATDVLQNAPEDSYVLFAGSGDLTRSLVGCSPERVARLTPRIVLLDISWHQALEQLERHRLAGAVDSLRMSEWLGRPSSCTGPFGFRYLTKALGVSCLPLPAFRSKHYCLLESQRHRGMPHLLANYLTAYDRDQKPLTALPSVALARVSRALIEGGAGTARVKVGREEELTPTSQVEYVSTKRAIAALKRAREIAGMTLPQVAESAGLDPELLGCLEGGDYRRATLGTLRGYVLALEPSWGWRLAESGETALPDQRKTGEPSETVRTSDGPLMESGVGAGGVLEDISALPELRAGRPWVMVERGMTVSGNRRIRRREPERELDKPSSRMRKEDSYASV